MYRPFRHYHILCILEGYDRQELPLDLFVKDYFKARTAVGSKDRAYVSDAVYTMVRWRGLLDFLCGSSHDWEKRLDIYLQGDWVKAQKRSDIPLHIRAGFPKHLFDLICESHGPKKGEEICRISNSTAPTTVRANLLKTTREHLMQMWASQFPNEATSFSKEGISFFQRLNFFNLPEFKQGLFEIQDEGSQLLAQLVDVKPGQLVMDFCAGAGGKTLAFAPRMQNKGQIYLHDVRTHALHDARKRLRRAGVQNAQIIEAEDPKLKKLKKKMDWVLVDAPCTGTGTLRRNPDMKWKFQDSLLKEMVSQQRVIFERALSYMKPQGFIVYATCSLLKQENQEQIAHFVKTYDLEVVGDIFESTPIARGMDGFFGAILRKAQKEA